MLVSPQALAATKEPILTAFSVSNKLYTLSKRREEYRDVYSDLAVEVSYCGCELKVYIYVTMLAYPNI